MSLQVKNQRNMLRIVCAAVAGFGVCSMLSGCLIAGYSSSGAGFIWPGGLGLLVVLGLLLWLVLRQR
jgi:hypothetical protein